MMQETIIRPGFLVSLKTSIKGNARYSRKTIMGEHVADDGTVKSAWETEKTIMDMAEHEASKKARADARNTISAVCAGSAFGLLCPQDSLEALKESISKAQVIVDTFNRTANVSKVELYVIMGKIESDDTMAASAINSEIHDLLLAMEKGIEDKNVDAIRAACNRGRELTVMLTAMAATRLTDAIKAAREVARKIVKDGTAGDDSSTTCRAIYDALECFE